jgi:sulfoxide reductase catalytic subunit YedY
MISFDAAHAAVHYPPDRRFRIWVRPSFLIAAVVLVLLPVLAAWIEFLAFGLPHIPPVPQIVPNNFAGPHGFPLWVRYCHFFNFVFLMMLIRSGLSILVDHPSLYFNNDCTPGSEWIRLTPIHVPTDRVWTAKDDARYISPIVATPGYRHTVGVARSWHFLDVYGFVLTGIFFVILLFGTEQWRRLVPQSTVVMLQAWNTWVHYATFHMPPEFNGYFGYNALQQIAYFSAVFVFGPLAILTGTAMSPAAVNRFPWYAKLFGGRQSARSIHFLTMLGFFAFIVVHVTLIVMTGFVRNMNHIVMGTDDQNRLGMILGFAGIAVVLLSWIGAHYVSWFYPRFLQHVQKFITYPLLLATLNRLPPSQHYTERDISPRFWPNGTMPVREDWKQLAKGGFQEFRLKVGGLVDNPVELSLADIEKLQRARHHYASLHPGLDGDCQVGWYPHEGSCRTGPAAAECQGGCLLLVWRVPLRGLILRHAEHGERTQAGVSACFPDEWEASPRGIWRPVAATRRKSAWLQDGQVD